MDTTVRRQVAGQMASRPISPAQSEVQVKDGQILLHFGNEMTGITWTGELPRMDYEIKLDAMRVDGTDFFCGLTFPVGDAPCSFIVGGWGGGVVGMSSLNGKDAARNETTQYVEFEKGRWYRIRVRVTQNKLEAWIDKRKLVDVDTTGKKISIRSRSRKIEAARHLLVRHHRRAARTSSCARSNRPSRQNRNNPDGGGGPGCYCRQSGFR